MPRGWYGSGGLQKVQWPKLSAMLLWLEVLHLFLLVLAMGVGWRDINSDPSGEMTVMVSVVIDFGLMISVHIER